MNKNQTPQNRSFRDPSGYVVVEKENVTRFLQKNEGAALLNTCSNSSVVKKWIENDKLISYSITEDNQSDIVLCHPKIDFPSYPFEWSASMLYSAGELTIDLALDLLEEKKGLKDASAYNILYKGHNPVFIDLASVEERDENNPYWLPYSQFIRMFILPLYLNRFYNISINSMLFNNHDGLSYNDCKKIARRYSLFEISLIHLPNFLSKYKSSKIYNNHALKNSELAQFIVKRLLNKAKKQLKKVRPKHTKKSNWSTYIHQLNHYSTNEFEKKCSWVKELVAKIKPEKVLDVGCNTGHFSVIAAKENAQVLSIDYDETVIDMLFNYAKAEKLNILPLVVNIARPTPPIGWKNSEYFSFLQRAYNHFDLVMMLAVIHHLLITDRIPMEEIADLAAKLTNNYLIIEFIEQKDPMFSVLTRGRDNLYNHITLDFFKKTFSKDFEFVDETNNSYHPTRKLLLLKKKSS